MKEEISTLNLTERRLRVIQMLVVQEVEQGEISVKGEGESNGILRNVPVV